MELFWLTESFLVSKKLTDKKREFHDCPSNVFLSHSAGKLHSGTLLRFRHFLVSKIFMDKKRDITALAKKFPHSTEKIQKANPFVFRKLSDINHALDGRVTVLLNFLSHRTKTKSFVKESFCFSEIFWFRELFGWEVGGGGGYHFIPPKNFWLTVPKN